MNNAKLEAIRVAATRLAGCELKMDILRQSATPYEPEARLRETILYHTAQAELNEARAEVNRVTDASFQPEE